MGLPLCMFAFGQLGLAWGVSYFVIVAMTHFSIGLLLYTGQIRFKPLITSPMTWAAAIALTQNISGIAYPSIIANTAELIANMPNPIMLILLGCGLAKIKFTYWQKPLLFAVLRIGGGFLTALLVAELMQLEGIVKAVVIIQASTASAVVNYILAKKYNASADDLAAMVVISTLLMLITMPLVIWYVLPMA